MPSKDDQWRVEAHCPVHFRQERITRVRSSVKLKALHEAYHTNVTLSCGENITIVTTARNINLMEVPT